MRRNVPNTYMLRSKRMRDWKTELALAELIDNAFEDGKGSATVVEITFDDNATTIRDNGHGMPDVNQLSIFGGHDVGKGISKYGVGGSDATAWLGNQITVRTIYEDRIHTYSFDWKESYESGEWPAGYVGQGSPANGEVGTIIIMEGSPARRGRRVTTISEELGRIYATGIRGGRVIRIVDNRRGAHIVTVVQPADPPGLKMRRISGTAAGLPWVGSVGFDPDLRVEYTGAIIGFGFRQIERTRDIFADRAVSGIYVTIDLAGEWADCLDDHKSRLITHRAQLMAAVMEAIAPELAAAERSASIVRNEAVAAIIKSIVADIEIGGSLPVDRQRHSKPYERDEAHPLPHIEQTPQAASNGIKVIGTSGKALSGRLGVCEIGDGTLTVYYNEDHPRVMGWKNDPINRECFSMLICMLVASATAARIAAANDPSSVERLMPRLHHVAGGVSGGDVDGQFRAIMMLLMGTKRSGALS